MNLTSDAAPWWFVGALAGSFTLLGGLITIGGSWLNDLIKAKRDKRRGAESDVLEAGAQMLADSDAIYYQALLSLNRTEKQWLEMLAKSSDLVDKLQLSTSRLMLIAPKTLLKPSQTLLGATLLLMIPLFDRNDRKRLIKEHAIANSKLRNAIRKFRGLPELDEPSHDKSFLDNLDDIAEGLRAHVEEVGKADEAAKAPKKPASSK